MEEDHYDTPWEFLSRPTSMRLSAADVNEFAARRQRDARLSAVGSPQPSPHASPSLSQSSSFVQQLVNLGNSAVEARRSKDRRIELKREELRSLDEVLLEKNVDRVEAEKRLESRPLGDFLLRSRGEGSAALSLRASRGVLHIKIEQKGDKWIIGEGPSFRSISSAVQYYRRHPLPIRGADHMLLNQQLPHALRI
ncbi:unnamed protein product [Caenorhabditis auriculariae]|uniref:SH2 domain-containing protein n=1 Tax=Caenorhabditis auriculariae TaxID=2777116 RepID=A0A8S1HCK8_9PELO|nr:unnamed protein product [Caenorhabditis auriculariae]